MYMNQELWQEIGSKHEFLKRRSPLEALLKDLFSERNHKDSIQHSVRLSNPTGVFFSKLSDNKKKAVLKSYQDIYNNLNKAWEYGLNNYKFPFDESYVLNIAYLIEPDNFPQGKVDYRRVTMGVRPGWDARVTPPYPAKIPIEIKRFFDDMQALYKSCQKDSADIVDVSSWIHLHFVRIHPFEDGNGRIARLLGNLVLIKNSYPPLVIAEGERRTYNTMLDQAKVGFRNRESKFVYGRDDLSKDEIMLYDYFAGKINTSLDRVLEGRQ